MTGWAPMTILTEPHERYWGIHLTFAAGPHEGTTIKWADVLMRVGKAKPMARRKLHGLWGRTVPPEEWDAMSPWQLDGEPGWFHIGMVFDDEDGRYRYRVTPEDVPEAYPYQYSTFLGWQNWDFYST